MTEITKINTQHKKEDNTTNKKLIPNVFLSSILKFVLAVALSVLLLSFIVNAGDVIVENGKLDVSGNLYVHSSGNVGIGTTNPSERLDVIGKIKGSELCIGNDCRTTWPSGGSGLPSGTTGQTLSHDGTNWVANSLLINRGTDNIEIQRNNEVYLNLRNTEGSGRQWALVSAGSSGGIGVGKFSIYDKTAATSRLTIDTNGNIGIATSKPAQTLQVAGTFNVSASASRESDLFIAGSGNVGIGTTLPSFRLDVTSTGSNAVRINSGSNTNHLIFATSGSSKWSQYLLGNDLRFYDATNSQDRVTFQAGGNVGIGTTNPTVKLDVNGPIKATGTGGNVLHNCVSRSNSKPIGPSDREVSVSCAAGEIITGGGCTHGSNYGLRVSIPEGSTVWHCVYTDYSTDIIIAYAICCQI